MLFKVHFYLEEILNYCLWFVGELTVNMLSLNKDTYSVSLVSADGASFTAPESCSSGSQIKPVPSTIKRFLQFNLALESYKGYLAFEVGQQEFYVQLTEDTELIEQMLARMQTEAPACAPLVNPVVGQACVAKFPDDEAWYRAQITELSGNAVKVLFVDYGNSCLVDGAQVLEISDELLATRPLAARCGLLNEDNTVNLTTWTQGNVPDNKIIVFLIH